MCCLRLVVLAETLTIALVSTSATGISESLRYFIEVSFSERSILTRYFVLLN